MSQTSRRPLTVVEGNFRHPGTLLELLDEIRLAVEAGTITEIAIAGVGPEGATCLQVASGRPLCHPMALLGGVGMLRRELEALVESGEGW